MDRFRGLDYLTALDELAPGWETHGGGEAFPRLKQVVVFPASGGDSRRRGILRGAQHAETGFSRPADPDPQSVCDIIYTSGTTGSPKGVMLSHDMVLRAAFGSVYSRAFDDAWRIVFSLPMYHVYGYIEGMLTTPFVGGAIIPHLQFDPAATLTRSSAPRRRRLVGADDDAGVLDELRREIRLPTLRAVISSGQRSPAGIWKEIFELMHPAEVTTGYGMTEVTATMTMTRPDDPFERLSTTNGRLRDVGPAGDPALGGKLVDYQVVDPDSGRTLRPAKSAN